MRGRKTAADTVVPEAAHEACLLKYEGQFMLSAIDEGVMDDARRRDDNLRQRVAPAVQGSAFDLPIVVPMGHLAALNADIHAQLDFSRLASGLNILYDVGNNVHLPGLAMFFACFSVISVNVILYRHKCRFQDLY